MRKMLLILLVPLFIGLVFLVLGNVKTPGRAIENWLPGVLTSTGVVFISVSLTELFVTYFRQWIKEKDQRAFEELFGVRASDEPGHIVLQDDRIDEVLVGLFEDPEQVRSRVNNPKPPHHQAPAVSTQGRKLNRLFKARRWINAHDADGAREIRDAFRKMSFAPPELTIEGRKGGYDHKQAPFLICMGLGFTVESLNIVDQVCKGWMLIDPATLNGDAVALHEAICPGDPPDFEEPLKSADGYKRLFPRGWYLETYLKVPDRLREGLGADDTGNQTSNDYAIILRHTELQPSGSQIRFVVAGFTAHGTAAAGRYLADKWRTLWTQYVKDHADGGDGDFCEIIVGNSGGLLWKRARRFPRLTPQYLASDDVNIDCEWTRQYLKRHARPSAVS